MSEDVYPGKPDFCNKIARQLESICVDVTHVENVFSMGKDEGAVVCDDAVVTLQKMDHIQQRLKDLVVLFDCFSRGECSETVLIMELKLRETRELILRRETSASVIAGEIELF